jgi:hypothetical protein
MLYHNVIHCVMNILTNTIFTNFLTLKTLQALQTYTPRYALFFSLRNSSISLEYSS